MNAVESDQRTGQRRSTRRGGFSSAAEKVVAKHSVSFTVPVIGRIWLGEPRHLAFYAGVGVLATLGMIEWPVAAVVVVGRLLADNAHREVLRDFGSALEAGS